MDGAGAQAKFFSPEAVTIDASGNLFVSDYRNAAIRKITPAGVVTTFARAPWSLPPNADLCQSFEKGASALAVDGANNVYAAVPSDSDYLGHARLIIKFTPSGTPTAYAGKIDASGSADGLGSTARFEAIAGMHVGADGSLYVTDRGSRILPTGNYNVRKIDPAGFVSTLAGKAVSVGPVDGPAAVAEFGELQRVAVSPAGTVYVSDSFNNTIRRITPDGTVSTFAGVAGSSGSSDGVGAAARFSSPMGLVVDTAGNVYVADNGNRTVRKITPAGMVTTLAGTPGRFGTADGVGPEASFFDPVGIALDTSGNLYVNERIQHSIRKITPSGRVTTFGTAALGSDTPEDVAVDRSGNVFVAVGNRIRKITPDGVGSDIAGGFSASPGGPIDGVGAAARFGYARTLTIDNQDNLYVGDAVSPTIRKVTPSGVVSTVIGSTNQAGVAPDKVPATVNIVRALSLSPSGALYAVSENSLLRIVLP